MTNETDLDRFTPAREAIELQILGLQHAIAQGAIAAATLWILDVTRPEPAYVYQSASNYDQMVSEWRQRAAPGLLAVCGWQTGSPVAAALHVHCEFAVGDPIAWTTTIQRDPFGQLKFSWQPVAAPIARLVPEACETN